MFRRLPLALLAAALTCSLTALPAQAQRARVFVASYGTDTGNTVCSFTQPCRTFQNAVSHVAAGGEVTAIDSAGFGPISITQSVTITSPNGVEAGVVTTAGTDAIDISGTSVTVVLRGLTLEGNGTANYGIDFTGGGNLEIIGCKVHNFVLNGISVLPTAATTVLVKDTVVSDNATYGILLQSSAAGATITAALDEITAYNNLYGVYGIGVPAPTQLLISNSHIDSNTSRGVVLHGGGGPNTVSAVLKNVTINQTPYGIYLQGDTSTWLSHVTQSTAAGFASSAGISFAGASDMVFSDGTSHIMGALSGGSLSAWTPQ